jgi:hypothetical protein
MHLQKISLVSEDERELGMHWNAENNIRINFASRLYHRLAEGI